MHSRGAMVVPCNVGLTAYLPRTRRRKVLRTEVRTELGRVQGPRQIHHVPLCLLEVAVGNAYRTLSNI